MSVLAEEFAKDFLDKSFYKDRKITWCDVVQALASYNWETDKFDVRLKISGLEDMKDEILSEYLKFMSKFKNQYIFYLNNSRIFGFFGEGIEKRIEKEFKKKNKILPFIIEKTKTIAKEIGKKLYDLDPIILLRGSASPKSHKIFWYYDNPKLVVASDVDLEILLHDFDKEVLRFSKNLAYRYSLKTKIPIDIHITKFYDAGEMLFEYGYPLFITSRYHEKSFNPIYESPFLSKIYEKIC